MFLVHSTKRNDRIAVVGVVILLGLYILGLFVKETSDNQRFTLVLLQALSAGAASSGLLGRLSLQGKWLGFSIKAAGGIALAVLVLALGMRAHMNDGHFARVNSPIIKAVVGAVKIAYGDTDVDPCAAEPRTINSPEIDGIKGDVTLTYGKTRIKDCDER